jgi:hypothetical protein
MKRTTLLIFTSLAIVGMVFTGWSAAASGEPPATAAASERHPPTFFMMAVVKGEDKAEGLAPEDMEKDWQEKTLSQDPLRVTAQVVERYAPDANEGRKCARVKGGIGQDLVPLKGKTYRIARTKWGMPVSRFTFGLNWMYVMTGCRHPPIMKNTKLMQRTKTGNRLSPKLRGASDVVTQVIFIGYNWVLSGKPPLDRGGKRGGHG